MEYREEDDQGVGDRGDRDSDAEALDLKNPHKWKDAAKQRQPWQPQRRMIARWWKQQQVIEIIVSRVREGSKGKRKTAKENESVLTEEEREYLREEVLHSKITLAEPSSSCRTRRGSRNPP